MSPSETEVPVFTYDARPVGFSSEMESSKNKRRRDKRKISKALTATESGTKQVLDVLLGAPTTTSSDSLSFATLSLSSSASSSEKTTTPIEGGETSYYKSTSGYSVRL